jgi:hypothetical protein
MIVDDKPFMKFTAKPNKDTGVESTPKSACGDLLIAYKDRDRTKRWDITLDFGDWDPEKMEMISGFGLLTAPSSAGRTFADGVTTNGSPIISSPSLGAFVQTDVGRTATGTGVAAGAYILSVQSGTSVTLSAPSTASASGLSIVLGTIASRTIGFSWPALLAVNNPNGVALEMWQKSIVRGTGYQGTTPYPSAGSSVAPALPTSAYIRLGVFRCYLDPADVGIEDKEGAAMFTGWAIENPLFGLGPMKDWTTTATAGTGIAVPTTAWANALYDTQLPSPRQAGYATTAA